ncbi:hypothetical protein LGW34_09310 [Streptococcus mutans]|nr:hypothetical protein [Streptococcus mutans]
MLKLEIAGSNQPLRQTITAILYDNLKSGNWQLFFVDDDGTRATKHPK